MGSGAVAWASWAVINDSAHYPSQTLAALPPNPFPFCAAAPLTSPPFGRRHPFHLLLSQSLQPHHQALAAPHLLLPRCHSLPLGSSSCGANLQSFWWREEGRKERGRIQGYVCVHLLFICAAIQLIRWCVCDWVEGLSRILGGGWTTIVLAVSGHFSWEINGNQFGDHVELCITFPMNIYALNLEL
jgi:hypothetical protein